METIKCFRYDQWLEVSPGDLKPGDQFNYEGRMAIVHGKPMLRDDGKWAIPAERPEPVPIQVDLSGGILAQVMDFAGTGLHEFRDGTAILADLEWAPGFVYSPRLPKAELEAFCETHRERYEAFFDANHDAILAGESVAMEPWWSSDGDKTAPTTAG
ncbi:hypothetical protein [Pseudomonas lopnurensis]|uniref:hypothetical protein n=1 Tax=Pseudomonas lopnurensis TaxID=1477517 RepID=UPI0028A73DC8|nr:hypothetical protein [Pseudomonas lopnurensis]